MLTLLAYGLIGDGFVELNLVNEDQMLGLLLVCNVNVICPWLVLYHPTPPKKKKLTFFFVFILRIGKLVLK